MAQDEILIKLRVEDGELKLSTQAINKQSKALDKSVRTAYSVCGFLCYTVSVQLNK